ncbi:MAG TPA: hypothetical protein VJC04_03185, partial [Candidatus Paceibacterota bacterium]
TKIKKLSQYAVIFGLLAMPLLVRANLPSGNAITIDDVSGIVGIIARFMIAMSMVCAVIFIVLSGIMTMVAQDDPKKFSNGLLRLKHAAIGAGVVLATGVIINTVAALVDRSFFCQISILGICLY